MRPRRKKAMELYEALLVFAMFCFIGYLCHRVEELAQAMVDTKEKEKNDSNSQRTSTDK